MKITKYLVFLLMLLSVISIGITWLGDTQPSKLAFTFTELTIILLALRVLLDNKKNNL